MNLSTCLVPRAVAARPCSDLLGHVRVRCPRLSGVAHLILLEDEPVLSEELTEFLVSVGHEATAVGSLAAFRRTYSPQIHSIAIIDLGLPDGDGLDLIQALRAEGHRLGIIVLTARSAMQDKVQGLTGGADHYLPKTADLQEIAATVAALSRRLGVDARPRWVLTDSPRQLISPGGAVLALSGQDHMVLHALASNPGYVTREAIVVALGGNYLDYDQRRLDTQMRRLRRKVEEACGLALPVSTLRGTGYRFHDDIDIRP